MLKPWSVTTIVFPETDLETVEDKILSSLGAEYDEPTQHVIRTFARCVPDLVQAVAQSVGSRCVMVISHGYPTGLSFTMRSVDTPSK